MTGGRRRRKRGAGGRARWLITLRVWIGDVGLNHPVHVVHSDRLARRHHAERRSRPSFRWVLLQESKAVPEQADLLADAQSARLLDVLRHVRDESADLTEILELADLLRGSRRPDVPVIFITADLGLVKIRTGTPSAITQSPPYGAVIISRCIRSIRRLSRFFGGGASLASVSASLSRKRTWLEAGDGVAVPRATAAVVLEADSDADADGHSRLVDATPRTPPPPRAAANSASSRISCSSSASSEALCSAFSRSAFCWRMSAMRSRRSREVSSI